MDNSSVGSTIKLLAQLMGYLFLFCGIFAFIYFLAEGFPFLLVITPLVGGIVMYCFTKVLYGFGQLVDDVQELRIAAMSKSKPSSKSASAADELPDL